MVADEQLHSRNVSWFSTGFRVLAFSVRQTGQGANYSGALSKMLLPGASPVQVLGDLVLIEVTMPTDDRVKGGGYGLESLNG
ncbi:hypothetical protein EAH74_24840 [Pseudomonas mandelii]|uniref:Uncharacterized protein n=1 Tax=Pseudomonas mandelii TaxID=75612 RepID=A0A502HZG0_9PSED|nr:hypothetical protein EAH74_24840 [Pseudomonas mandelii]